MTAPIGVPGPTRVRRSLASLVNMPQRSLVSKHNLAAVFGRFEDCQAHLQRALGPDAVVRGQGRIARPGIQHQVELGGGVTLRVRGAGVDVHLAWSVGTVDDQAGRGLADVAALAAGDRQTEKRVPPYARVGLTAPTTPTEAGGVLVGVLGVAISEALDLSPRALVGL